MTEYQKAELLSREIDRLRQELIMSARSMHRTVFIFIMAFVGIIGIYFGKGIMDEAQKAKLILLLSQIEILLCLFFSSLWSYHLLRVGYIRALEHKLNVLAKDNITIWESKITSKYMQRWSCFYVICLVQAFAATVIFVILIYLVFKSYKHPLWGVIFTIEAMTCLALYIWIVHERKLVERYAKEAHGCMGKRQ